MNSRLRNNNSAPEKHENQNDFEDFIDSEHSSFENEQNELEENYQSYSKALFEQFKVQDYRSEDKIVKTFF